MRKISCLFCVALFLNIFPLITLASYAGGTGVVGDPYQLSTCEQLQAVNLNLGAYFLVTDDIDCSETVSWNEGLGFLPLGSTTDPFIGNFNGAGHKINDLVINRGASDNIAPFGYVGAGGVIERVGINRGKFTGSGYTAGLVSQNFGTISQSYAVSDVTTLKTLASYSAGLVGLNEGTVTDSYARGSVTGTSNARIAGLIGNHKSAGSLTNSFAASVISGSGDSYMKGLIAYPASSIGSVSNSFWDINVSGQDVSFGGTGTTTDVLKMLANYTSNGWSSDIWAIDVNKNHGYPYLKQNDFGLDPIIEIYNITDLQNIQTNLGGRYIQMAEIDASVTSTWGEGAGFTPLTIFYGSFDGNGYYITNLTINRPTTDYVGVFAQNRGTVSNFKLADSSITGRDYVGALAGYNSGTIYRSKAYRLNDSSNQVNGYSYTAGLVGYNGPVGTISQSYAVSDVTTLKTLASYSAGLVGLNEGTVTDSYARGSVTGTRNARIAGLIGYHKSAGSLTNSFAASVISGSGDSYMKGLIAYPASSWGTVTNSFWDINVSGQDVSFGGTGTTTSALKTASTFTDVGWDLEDAWHMDGIKNDGYPYLNPPIIPPVEIANITDLQNIINSPGFNYIQTADIDASITASWNGGAGFLPIPSFTGSFDGNGYYITNLTINRPTTDYVGVFAQNRGTVSNFKLADSSITGRDYVGALAGYNSGTIYRSKAYRLNDSSNQVNGYSYTAGLVGYNGPVGTISQSYAVSDVTTLKTLASYSAGLVGLNEGTVTDSYARGSVTGTRNARIAGLIGYHKSAGSLTNSFAASVISGSGDSYMKGLIAYPASSWGTVTNSFWDINVSGQDVSFGGTGTTTSALKTASTFTDVGWDLEDAWHMDGIKNDGYPYFLLDSDDFVDEDPDFTLIVNRTGEGVVYVNASLYSLPLNFSSGTAITLIASSSPGWSFDSWSDGSTSTEKNFELTANETFGVTFVSSEPEEEEEEDDPITEPDSEPQEEITVSRSSSGSSVSTRLVNLLKLGETKGALDLWSANPNIFSLQDLTLLLAHLKKQGSLSVSTEQINRNLKLGDISPEVVVLQKFLNKNGFVLTQNGPGSLDQETNKFGLLTQKALIKFQEFYADEILKPLGLTTGTGYLGRATRNKIQEIMATGN